MLRVICAGHAIKEVLSAAESLFSMECGVRRAAPGTEPARFVVSDGGDGFLDAYHFACDGEIVTVPVTGPLGDSIQADFYYDSTSRRAIIESARAIGLALVPPQNRDVLQSGTAGLADLLASARQHGAREIIIGLGGSATSDGGIGLLWRLHHYAQSQPGAPAPTRTAADLATAPAPDLAAIRRWLGDLQLIASTDVDNPLTGPHGAVRSFARQKGATPQQLPALESAVIRWADQIESRAGAALRDLPGAGAAGGLGFALLAIGARREPGAQTLCEWIGLPEAIQPGDIVMTTEGKFDETSLHGKAPWTVAQLACTRGARPVIFCGIADESAIATARQHDIDVCEFGRDLPAADRAALTPGRLVAAVEQYLTRHREATR